MCLYETKIFKEKYFRKLFSNPQQAEVEGGDRHSDQRREPVRDTRNGAAHSRWIRRGASGDRGEAAEGAARDSPASGPESKVLV